MKNRLVAAAYIRNRLRAEVERLEGEVEGLRAELRDAGFREVQLMDAVLSAEARHAREIEALSAGRAYLLARAEAMREEGCEDGCDYGGGVEAGG